jgi:hypothetical protein
MLHQDRRRLADLRRLVGEVDSEEDVTRDRERQCGHLVRDVHRLLGRCDSFPATEHRPRRLGDHVE